MASTRPSYHLTPWRHWSNDPNGLVYYQGQYHAFYQHNPDAMQWGPMHWGHATSADLYRWRHAPIALYPDALGTCFSGSAVVDHANTSGLGEAGQAPLVILYTAHPEAAADGRHYEAQRLAYSLDGERVQVYGDSPVIPNEGTADFRDPKLLWFERDACWICVLAVADHVAFYRSPDLIHWEHSGDFGPLAEGYEGVWECPDLIPLRYEGETHWVLIVSLGRSAEAGGGVMQYLIGDFDGRRFRPYDDDGAPRRVDEGTDHYATTTFSGLEPPCQMGWAANPAYAGATPTEGYRGMMTAPRYLALYRDREGRLALAATPVPLPAALVAAREAIAADCALDGSPIAVTLQPEEEQPGFELCLENEQGERVVLGQDEGRRLYLDRSASGRLDYHPLLAEPDQLRREVETRTARAGSWWLSLDGPLLELYADDGSRVLTMLVFPTAPYTRLRLRGLGGERAQLLRLLPYEAPQVADPFALHPDPTYENLG